MREGSKREATRHEVAWPEGREPGREAARPNNGTVDLEKRLEAHAALLQSLDAQPQFVADVREVLTQLREYRTALEARPAMPEREAIGFDIPDLLKRLDDWGPGATAVRKDCLEAAAVIRALMTGDVREAAPEREGPTTEQVDAIALECEAANLSKHPGDLYRAIASRVASLASPPSAHDMREALEKIALTKFGLQNVIEDHGHDTNAYNYHAMVYWERLATSYQEIARAALASSPMDAVKAAVEDEREACAKVAEHIGRTQNGYTYEGYANDIAQAIRARDGGAK